MNQRTSQRSSAVRAAAAIPFLVAVACACSACATLCGGPRFGDLDEREKADIESTRKHLKAVLKEPKGKLLVDTHDIRARCGKSPSVHCADEITALGLRDDFSTEEKVKILLRQLGEITDDKVADRDDFGRPNDHALRGCRSHVPWALWLSGPRVLPAIVEALRGAPQGSEYRQLLVIAAARLGEPSVARELLGQTVSAKDPFIRFNSMERLNDAARKRGYKKILGRDEIMATVPKWVIDPWCEVDNDLHLWNPPLKEPRMICPIRDYIRLTLDAYDIPCLWNGKECLPGTTGTP